MLKRITSIPLTAIVLISLCLKLVFYFYISPWDKKVEAEKIVVSDSWGYEQVAENLLKYHAYGMPSDTFHISNYSDYRLTGYLSLHPDSYRMPLYSTFMAAVYFVAGIKPYLVILFQILLSLFSVVFVHRISMVIFNRMDMAKIAALLFALDIHSAFVANELLTDTLFVVLFLASTYYFLKGLKNNSIRQILAGGVFMGFSALTRGIVLFYPAIILVIILAFSKQPRLWKLKAFLGYFVVFACLTGSWSLRNELRYGHWGLATEDGSGVLMYYAAYSDANHSHRNIDSVRVQYQQKADSLGFRKETDVFKQSEIYKKVAMVYIKKNKFIYIKSQLIGGINMFFAIGNVGMSKILGWDESKHEETLAEVNTNRILANFKNDKREAFLGLFILLILALEYIGALWGSIGLFKNKQYLFLVLFLLTAAYFTAITGVVGTYRYKLAVIPFICIAAGYGYVNIKRKNMPLGTLEGNNRNFGPNTYPAGEPDKP